MGRRRVIENTKPELKLRGNRKINICSTYLPTNEEQAWNDIYSCIQKDMCTKFQGEPVIIVGDFNWHVVKLGEIDQKAENFRGPVRNHNLLTANLEPNCTGKIIWTWKNQQSTIDYVLINKEAEKESIKITSMHIDESKTRSWKWPKYN